ncbi:MAG: hypothetical protein C3F02_01225 [Parcubacteria group bacterium]|nr:MAG: hypothetical protein C3F02_01225 [Parcubacteria group bacterium]
MGQSVTMSCYNNGCEDVEIHGILGQEYRVGLGFTGQCRFHWPVGTLVRAFHLHTVRECPRCDNLLGQVMIVSNGPSRRPTIFGLDDPEPTPLGRGVPEEF